MTTLARRAAYLPATPAVTFPRLPLVVKIEIAFGADLTADPATWVYYDVTRDWQPDRDLAAKIGRQDATSKAQPGSLNLWLKNTGGDYTKGNPTSPWWPYIRKNTPIRVTLDPGTGHVRQYGMYVSQWIPRWGTDGSSGRQPLVQVVANGVRRRLTQGGRAASPLRRTIMSTKPAAYWPVEDGTEASQAASALAGHPPLIVTGSVAFKPVPDFFGIDPTAIKWGTLALADLSQGGSLAATLPAAATTATASQWTVHAWAEVDAINALSGDMTLLEWTCAGGTYLRWRLVLTVSGSTRVYGVTASGSTVLLIDYGSSTAGFTSYAVTAQAVGASVVVTLWQADDVAASTTVTAALAGVTSIAVNPTGVTSIIQLPCGHLTVFAATRVPYIVSGESGDAYGAVVTFARDSWEGEIAFDRMARLCAEEGIPFTIVGVPPSVEDFEDETLAYTITGTWARSNDQARGGNWSLKSAPIGNSATSDAVVTVPAGAQLMEVWYKVSSESGFDFFRILLDGVQEFQASGEDGWWQHVVDVTGVSQVTFRYSKDSSGASGSDAAWIDDLRFMVNPPPPVRMGPQPIDTFMNLLGECEDADGGILLDGLGPGFTYITRSAAYNLPVSLTVDMAGRQFKAPFEPMDDDTGLINDKTVTRAGGSSARYVATDADSPDAIGRYDNDTTLNLEQDTDLIHHAAWRVHLGTATADVLRFPGIGFDLHTAAGSALIEPWLQGGVRTRVQVINPPSEYGPGPIDLLIEGYSETVSSRRVLSVAANTSPYDPWQVFVLGQDRLDADAGSVLTADISATATTFQVQSSGAPGAAWTTNPAEWTAPQTLYLNVGGEQMQVTNITGASSPQTFTVTRSVNGVTKAQKAGTHVGLWQPRVLAL